MDRDRAVWLLARLLGNDYPVKPRQIDFLAEQLDEIERNARLDERVKVAESQDWSQKKPPIYLNDLTLDELRMAWRVWTQEDHEALLDRPRLTEAG